MKIVLWRRMKSDFRNDFQNEYRANFIKAGNHHVNNFIFWKPSAHKQWHFIDIVPFKENYFYKYSTDKFWPIDAAPLLVQKAVNENDIQSTFAQTSVDVMPICPRPMCPRTKVLGRRDDASLTDASRPCTTYRRRGHTGRGRIDIAPISRVNGSF